MASNSDPFLRRADAPVRSDWFLGAERAGIVHQVVMPPQRHVRQHRWGFATVAVVVAVLALNTLASLVAKPLDVRGGAAPLWSVEVTSASKRPVTVLAYGRESGLHLLHVPAANSRDEARVIPARLARGELHIISLGLSSLRVRTASPPGAPSVSWSATGRSITAFQRTDGTGVRTSW